MKVYNLKTKLLTSSNTVDEKKLYSVLNQNITNNKPFQLINKTQNTTANNVYDIKLNGIKYLLKTLHYSQLTDIDKEISNMTRINNNHIVKPYILQCKYLVRTNDTIVSIFESVDSMLINDFIKKINSLKDNEKQKMRRYLIIGLLKAISDLHIVNVCHLNININNILVNINHKFNNNVYTTENPLFIKFINFNLQFNNRKKQYISPSKLTHLDPYINYEDDRLITLEEAKCYDLWCISLIILKIILYSDIYYTLIEKLISSRILDNTNDILPDFIIVYNNLAKYVFTDLNKRETGDFILNKIILDEKHN
jgi:serine/threonine protein kinase